MLMATDQKQQNHKNWYYLALHWYGDVMVGNITFYDFAVLLRRYGYNAHFIHHEGNKKKAKQTQNK